MVIKMNKDAIVIDADYFTKASKKLSTMAGNSRSFSQELTLQAFKHADEHGDWTSSILPIISVIVGTDKVFAGAFGPAYAKLFVAFVTAHTKLVYNPKGLNGRKLNKLTMPERFAWDAAKKFDHEKAAAVNWWLFKREPTTSTDFDATDFAARTVKRIQKAIDDGDIANRRSFIEQLEGMLATLKDKSVVTASIVEAPNKDEIVKAA